MLLVIFGAGASFDSVPEPYWTFEHAQNRDRRPPLAADLMDARFEFVMHGVPYSHEIVAEVRSALMAEQDVEEELERLASNTDDRTVRQLLALRYYLSRVIGRCSNDWGGYSSATNYAGLLSRLERWRPEGERIAFVTFNYDRLLEQAITLSCGRTFDRLDDFVFREKYGVFKLHGSVDWLRVVRANREANMEYLIENAPEIQVTG